MGENKLPEDQGRRRLARAMAMRRYRARHPDQVYIQRLRDARNLLEREGFVVAGGNVDIRTGSEKQERE